MATAVAVPAPKILLSMAERAFNQTFKCLVENCRYNPLRAGDAFVPDLRYLYQKIRGDGMNHRYPLTLAELMPFVRCHVHAIGECGKDFNQREGIEWMFPILGTAGAMDNLARRNVQDITAERASQHQQLAFQRAVERGWALRRPDDKGFVNQSFATALVRREGPAPKHRNHTEERKHFQLVKMQRNAAPAAQQESRRKKLGKKGGDENKRGNRGKRH